MQQNQTYHIYHIVGRKIGVSINPNNRIKRQLAENEISEILETHNNIITASLRERELQIKYGYQTDHLLYYQTIGNSTLEGRIKAGKIAVKSGQLELARQNANASGALNIGRIKAGQANVLSGHILRIRQLAEESGALDLARKKAGKNNVESGHLKKLSENNKKPIVATSITTGEIIEFNSSNEAAKYFKINNSNICKALKGVYKSSKGFIFKYK